MSKKYAFEIDFYESILGKNPKYEDVIEILGELYTSVGRITDGLRMDRKLVRLRPQNANAHYNLACSLALKKRKADAVRALNQAVELGYDDYEWLLQDPDLDCLKDHPGFLRLIEVLHPDN